MLVRQVNVIQLDGLLVKKKCWSLKEIFVLSVWRWSSQNGCMCLKSYERQLSLSLSLSLSLCVCVCACVIRALTPDKHELWIHFLDDSYGDWTLKGNISSWNCVITTICILEMAVSMSFSSIVHGVIIKYYLLAVTTNKTSIRIRYSCILLTTVPLPN